MNRPERISRQDVPEVHQALLDPDTLDALLDDIRQCTRLLEVLVREPGRKYASDQPIGLEEACSRFRSGDVFGLQIRYEYEGDQWWDTLARIPAGVRLTRIRHRVTAG